MTIAEYYQKYIAERKEGLELGVTSSSTNQKPHLNGNRTDMLDSLVREVITGGEKPGTTEQAWPLQWIPSGEQPFQELPVATGCDTDSVLDMTPMPDEIHDETNRWCPSSTPVGDRQFFQRNDYPGDECIQPTCLEHVPISYEVLNETGYASGKKEVDNHTSAVSQEEEDNIRLFLGDDSLVADIRGDFGQPEVQSSSAELNRDEESEKVVETSTPSEPSKKIRSVNDWISSFSGEADHQCLLCKETVRQESNLMWMHIFKKHKMSLDLYFSKHVRASLKTLQKPKIKCQNKQIVGGRSPKKFAVDPSRLAEATAWTEKNTYPCSRCNNFKGTKFLTKLKQHYR